MRSTFLALVLLPLALAAGCARGTPCTWTIANGVVEGDRQLTLDSLTLRGPGADDWSDNLLAEPLLFDEATVVRVLAGLNDVQATDEDGTTYTATDQACVAGERGTWTITAEFRDE